MKCPKCKYTTFDYVEICPRCGKDISAEKAKLHIIAIKPNTPFLLGSLTGDLNDSSAAFVVPESGKKASESMTIDVDEIYDDGSNLDINIDDEPLADSENIDDLDLKLEMSEEEDTEDTDK